MSKNKSASQLPPVIQILRDEDVLNLESDQDFISRLTDPGFIKDLSNQSQWTLDNFKYADDQESSSLGEFHVIPTGSMNPFSPIGKCSNPSCHVLYLDNFIKTIGLYTDKAYIVDPITTFFQHTNHSNILDLLSFKNHISTLKTLLPLVDAGIINFLSPVRRYCKDCVKKVDQIISKATETLVKESGNKLKYHTRSIGNREFLAITNPIFVDDPKHPLIVLYDITNKNLPSLKTFANRKTKSNTYDKMVNVVNEIFFQTLLERVKSLFIEMSSCQETHSVVVSGSRHESLVFAEIQKIRPLLNRIDNWETLRSVNLPWISELSPNDILLLRNESKNALPQLRRLLSKKLNTPSECTEVHIRNLVLELRAQAAEVQAELEGLALSKERRYRLGMGGLGISFVIYGLFLGHPTVAATGIASMLALLAHLRSHEISNDKEIAKLSTVPGFVLFKAKQILTKKSK
jgi:hypothetical protein